ncbi:glycerol-3-phosphate acyltransferase [Candidatus Dependentiae bacterium]|nr:glycerol-3-phosphate acyltransferase [Candidatus Dependentiae bacterium]
MMLAAGIFLICMLAYLVGSIPTGYWFARYFFNIDVTKYGSGNIGATNVARVLGGIKYFFLIFFIDAGKAVTVLWLTKRYVSLAVEWQPHVLCIVAASLLLGNSFSVFLRGRGGKNVATLFGCIIFLYPLWFVLAVLACWGLIFALTRTVYIASILAAIAAIVLYWTSAACNHGLILGIFLSAACFWLIWRHKSNIKQFFAKG